MPCASSLAARPCAVLWRAGAGAQCAVGLHALLCHRRVDERAVAGCGLFHRLWRGWGLLGRAGQGLSGGRHGGQPDGHPARQRRRNEIRTTLAGRADPAHERAGRDQRNPPGRTESAAGAGAEGSHRGSARAGETQGQPGRRPRQALCQPVGGGTRAAPERTGRGAVRMAEAVQCRQQHDHAWRDHFRPGARRRDVGHRR